MCVILVPLHSQWLLFSTANWSRWWYHCLDWLTDCWHQPSEAFSLSAHCTLVHRIVHHNIDSLLLVLMLLSLNKLPALYCCTTWVCLATPLPSGHSVHIVQCSFLRSQSAAAARSSTWHLCLPAVHTLPAISSSHSCCHHSCRSTPPTPLQIPPSYPHPLRTVELKMLQLLVCIFPHICARCTAAVGAGGRHASAP
jgi:hypothetical protein